MDRRTLNITVVTVLLALILIALGWQATNNRTITLFPNDDYQIFADSDASSLGGVSQSRLLEQKERIKLVCEIKQSDYAWPFCNVTIVFGELAAEWEKTGLDLSRFSSVQVKARYLNAEDLTFRVQLRNYNPVYSDPNVTESWKFLTTEFPANNPQHTYLIPIQALQVPTWWINYNKIPLNLSMPEYDQIMVFELATGNGIPFGTYDIEISEIKVIGKFFYDEELFMWIIVILIATIFYFLLNNIRYHRLTVKKQREKVLELSEINRFLELKNESLKDKVNIDALTGVLNRHASESIFPKLKNGDSIIIMDLDHFKSINDRFGHDVGDQVLLVFARAINSRLRKNDYFIRWGGEEFLGVCFATSAVEAKKIANKFRKELKNTVWPEKLKVTCSFGVAEMSYGESPEMLLKRADSALYQAKHQGRDKVNLS